MTVTDVISTFETFWNGAKAEVRLANMQRLRTLIPSEHHELFDGLMDAKMAGIQDDPSATVVILIHGIQTDGAWQRLVQNEFKDLRNTNVIDLGYDCVTAAQLASPLRHAPIQKITRELREARIQEPKARFMVIAHSFGTYILSKILTNEADIKFERIVLCGCIMPRDFRWDLHARDMKRGSILNDVGTRDCYPLIATVASLGYGSSGLRGFQSTSVHDRYFNYGHSDFFVPKKLHIRKFWKPFIANGTVKASRWDVRKPKTCVIVLALSHPWIGRPATALSIVFLAWLVWKSFTWTSNATAQLFGS